LETDTSDAVLGLESCGVFLEDPAPAGIEPIYTLGHLDEIITALRNKIRTLTSTTANADKLVDDFIEDIPVLQKFASGELDVKAWEKLATLTDPTRQWSKRSLPLLERMKGQTNLVMDNVKDYYSTHQMPSTRLSPPPFTHNITLPDGRTVTVDFDAFGHPNFLSYISDKSHVVKIIVDGTNADYIRAYDKLKVVLGSGNIDFTNPSGSSFKIKNATGTWSEPYTWHHHEDGESMIPVLQAIHGEISHTGGRSVVSPTNPTRNIKGFFFPPKL
jgi:hypothetical protein